MRTLCKLNRDSFNTLDPAGNVDVFLNRANDVTTNVIKLYSIWNFFRDRLELRFVPQFQQLLLVADLISHDCYATIMDRAKALRITPEQGFREYPLIGLVAQFSPATWRRGLRFGLNCSPERKRKSSCFCSASLASLTGRKPTLSERLTIS